MDDLACGVCGYNLRGLSTSGACPECGAAVDHALHGGLLRFSDPRWVRTIARGFWLQSATVAIGVAAIVVAAVFREALGIPWLVLAIALTAGSVGLLGVWLATTREPAAAGHERPFTARRLLRSLTIAGVLLQAGSGYIAQMWPQGALSVRLVAAAVMISGILCAFRHAINLALRIPDPALVTETRSVMWGLFVSYGIFLTIIALALSDVNVPLLMMLACGMSCTIAVACVVFTLWSLTLFARYAHAMRLVAVSAELLRTAAMRQ